MRTLMIRVLSLVLLLTRATGALATPQSDAAYQAALAAYNAKQYAEAIRQAEAAAAADPALWQAWQLDGNARVALGDTAGAVTVYKYALRGNPNNPSLQAYVNQLSGASASTGGAAAAGASAPDAQYQSAVAKYNAGNYDGCMTDAAAVVRANPAHWQAWQLLGNARYARGDKKGALEAYDKSLAAHPDNPQIKGFADQLRSQLAAQPAQPRTAVAPPSSVIKPAGAAGELQLTPGVSLGVGYAFANLATLRADLKSISDLFTLLGASPTLSDPPGLFQVTLTGEVPFADVVGGMVRVSYDLPMTAQIAVGDSAIAFKTSAILATAGVYARMGETDGVQYGGALTAGLIKVASDYELTSGGTTDSAAFGGSGLAIQISGELGYPVADGLTAFLELGYQIAKLSALTASADSPALGFKAGDQLTDFAGNPADFDMGGLLVRVGLRFGL